MYENNNRNVQPMMYGNQPIQSNENMYPQAFPDMPNQMYPTVVQGAYQSMERDPNHQCRKYMNYYVQAKMKDGTDVEGIITAMDENNVQMLIPEDVEEEEFDDTRQGYGRRRFRRFRRRIFPLLNFLFFRPYPYYYPPYPYPYYPYPYY